MKNIINDAIKFATTIADSSPEQYRVAAFQVALEYYLNHNNPHSGKKMKKDGEQSSTTKMIHTEDVLEKILLSDFDWSLTKLPKLESMEQYLLLLQIVKTEFQIDILSPEQIRKILYEKFRINKTVNNVGMTLMKKVGSFVDRHKITNGYSYKITSTGELHLNDVLKNMSDDNE